MSGLPPLEQTVILSLRGMTVTLTAPSAWALLEAQQEAAALSPSAEGQPLAANACVLSKTLTAEGEPLFQSGTQVLRTLTSGEIGQLAAQLAGLGTLCPACRETLAGNRCRRCGSPLASSGENPAFDPAVFDRLAQEGSL